MSDNQLIRWIRQTPDLLALWESLTKEQKRQALADAGGDTWHIDQILEDAKEC